MLVLDTEITREFLETIDVLGATHATKVIRFVIEVIKTAKSMENELKVRKMQLDEKDEQIACLMRSIDEMQEETDEAEGSV